MSSTLKFRLIHGCHQDASSREDSDVDFLLEEDASWDDYGYHTSFFLHATKKITNEKILALGVVSIMNVDRHQDYADAYLLIERIGYDNVFSELPADFCSLTTSLNVYKQVYRYLTPEQRRAFEQSLHLILDSGSDYYAKVCRTECFRKSLLRDTDINDYALIFGKEKLRETLRQYELRTKEIKVKFDNCYKELNLQFSPLKINGLNDILPNGVVAFIGKNGSGKSTLLYRLATELFASANNRKIKIAPEDIVVSQLMLFSYSPFDNFTLPVQGNKSSLKRWYGELKKFKESQNEAFKPRFIYCGIRDVEQEVSNLISAGENGTENSYFDADENYKEGNRLAATLQKNITDLSNECLTAFNVATYLRDEYAEDWKSFVKNVNEVIPELKISAIFSKENILFYKDTWVDSFKKLSTGHKFFLHAMSHLIAYCEENSIVMFDEPENHLQAPLLSFMMREIRRLLARRSSVMLVATHSPVILQETLSCNVRVIRRYEEKVTIEKPNIETYGASFGAISSDVFDLTSDKVSYFEVLKSIFNQEKCSEKESVKEAVKAVSECLGDISDVAIRYIVQLYLKSKEDCENVAST